jgi:hypothetical protein
LPSNENLNSGSKLNRLSPIDKETMVAGLPKEKVGMNEMPLLVTKALPEK